MDYATLKIRVQDAMGRSDVPSYVYELVTADLNRDLRVIEMETTKTISASSEDTAMPTNVLEVITAYLDKSPRKVLRPMSEDALNYRHDNSGEPSYYAIVDGSLRLMPVPDGTYSVVLRYYGRLSDLTTDASTNDVMTNHPGLYIYGALMHAAVWAQDTEMAQVYQTAFSQELARANKSDISRRNSGPMTSRPSVGGF